MVSLLQGPLARVQNPPTMIASVKITALQTTVVDSVVTDLKISVQVTTADNRTASGDKTCGKQVGPAQIWICGDSPAVLASDQIKLKLAIAKFARAVFLNHFNEVPQVDASPGLQAGGVAVNIVTPDVATIDPTTIAPNATLSADDISTILAQ